MTPGERYERAARRLRALQATGERTCGPPVSEDAILAAEQALDFRFPASFRRLLMQFGPLVTVQSLSVPSSHPIGRFLKREVLIRSRTSTLTPGSGDERDLVAVARHLRHAISPLPLTLIPYQVTETGCGDGMHRVFDCFDLGRSSNSEVHTARWSREYVRPGWTSRPSDGTFLEELEFRVAGRGVQPYAEPAYVDLRQRLNSETCTDQFVYASPANPGDIAETERILGVDLPESYKHFLLDFGPAVLGAAVLNAVPDAEQGIARVFRQQHRRWWRPLPFGLVPFALDTSWAGPARFERSYVCFDYRRLLAGEPRVTTWAPRSPKDDRLEETDQGFLDWLEQEVGRVEKDPDPPRDWRDNAAWDRYWRRMLRDDHSRGYNMASLDVGLWRLLQTMRQRGYRRILFAGNGIAMAAHAFASLGFEVTALDVSEAASQAVKTCGSPDDVQKILDHGAWISSVEDEAERAALFERAPGGSVTAVTADMFTYTPEEPFDVVYSNRAFQGFATEDRRALAARFFAWTRPGGICIVETINLCSSGAYREIEADFEGTGFVAHAREAVEWYDRAINYGFNLAARKRRADSEMAGRVAAEQERDSRVTEAGGRMVYFSHGSG